VKIYIFNHSKSTAVDKKKIVATIKKVLREEEFKLNELNIVIERDNYLKKLNKMFFKKDRATNVISFNLDEISEIYVSYDRVKNPEELYYYIVHGLLHIIGYDHRNSHESKNMRDKCLRYTSDV
jgi:probable rRNA maturation factor